MQVLIRADGGPDIGFGHLMRTKALASELNSRGHQITYITETKTHTADICGDIADIIEIPEEVTNRSFLVERIEESRVEVVVLDCFEADLQYQQAIRDKTKTLVLLQHYDQHRVSCDILVNGNIFAGEMEVSWKGPEPVWCQGLDYVLLRDSFLELADKSARWRPDPEHVLVMMGGSDVNRTTPGVIKKIAGLNPEFTTTVIVGPGFEHRDEIERVASELSAPFTVEHDPENLPELMFESDVGISATGTTVYELIATQTPVVGSVESDNQRLLAETLTERELAVIRNGKTWQDAIETLVTDREYRKKLFNRYNSLIDGCGTERIGNIIQQETIQRR